jgi:hypothetical protein
LGSPPEHQGPVRCALLFSLISLLLSGRGAAKGVDTKNEPSHSILNMVEVLRKSSGRKMARFEKPVVSQQPSIQGLMLAQLRDESRGPEPPPDRVRRAARPSSEKKLDSQRSKEAIRKLWPDLNL